MPTQVPRSADATLASFAARPLRWSGLAFLALAGCAGSAGPEVPDVGYRGGESGKADGAPLDYATYYTQSVLPYCLGRIEEGSFSGVAGLTIRTMALRRSDARASLVIFPGRTEPALKYCEVLYDLRSLPVSVFVMDHRGQGFSDRMLPDPQKGHVEEFSDYVDDAESYVNQVKAEAPDRKLFVLAHSMGGAIATRLAERDPSLLDALVLSSPMEEVNTAPYPELVALGYAKALAVAGKGGDYAPGKKGYDPNEPFDGNDVTHSRERFAMTKQVVADHPELAVGGPTAKWVEEAIEGTIDLRALAFELTTPTLLLQAGDDQVVKLGGQDWVCNRAADCTKQTFAGASHELMQEKDAIRDEVIDAISGFFTTHL